MSDVTVFSRCKNYAPSVIASRGAMNETRTRGDFKWVSPPVFESMITRGGAVVIQMSVSDRE